MEPDQFRGSEPSPPTPPQPQQQPSQGQQLLLNQSPRNITNIANMSPVKPTATTAIEPARIKAKPRDGLSTPQTSFSAAPEPDSIPSNALQPQQPQPPPYDDNMQLLPENSSDIFHLMEQSFNTPPQLLPTNPDSVAKPAPVVKSKTTAKSGPAFKSQAVAKPRPVVGPKTVHKRELLYDSESESERDAKPETTSTLNDFLKTEDDREVYEVLNFQLHNLLRGSDADTYKKAVAAGKAILSDIKQTLSDAPDAAKATGDIGRWIEQINGVERLAEEARTIIGVVGNTGCGKSSLINALIEEERLIPTSTVRACTAVVTEISYNIKYPEHKYAAEVEFITVEDWEKELKILYDELLSGSGGVSNDNSHADTEAGIAWHKIKSVYPHKTKEMVSKTKIEQLLQEPRVKGVLGTTKIIKEDDVKRFYTSLQFYIDSKEKRTKEQTKAAKARGEKAPAKPKEKQPPREMEYWPLIRVVKIFVKASVLDTGAIIVDLPGVHDSNEARANVAKNYIKNCNGLWIVAPIIRAVDDKAAKDLLGDQFKRQLQMDGGYSLVTFICSKTDDISITEAISSLPEIAEQLEEKIDLSDELWKKASGQSLAVDTIGEELDHLEAAFETYEKTIDIWEELLEQAESGETVYEPSGKKRKSPIKRSGRNKRRRRVDDSSDSNSDSDHEAAEATDDDSVGGRKALTVEMIKKKLEEFTKLKRHYRRKKNTKKDEKKEAEKALEQLEDEAAKLEKEIFATCIEQRNTYSREAIRQDFAQGLAELDQESAEDEDAENYNPEESRRDYGEIGRNLPVFCISSKGYQKLQGRLRKDADLTFTDIEQTEIPQLKRHCRGMTDDIRVHGWGQFLTQLSRFLNSLGICVTPMGNRSFLDPESGKKAIEAAFANLAINAKKVTKEFKNTLETELDNSIFSKYETGVDKSADAAIVTSTRWGAKRNRVNFSKGGYAWATYKALCRRDGVFTGTHGFIDMNQQLLQPMLQYISRPWDACFNRRIPTKLAEYTKLLQKEIHSLHQNAIEREQRLGGNVGRFHMIDTQIEIFEENIKQIGDKIQGMIKERQCESNRMFHPKVQATMHRAYELCTNESGPGSFDRMKAIMDRHVEANNTKMFSKACEEVQTALEDLTMDVIDEIERQIGSVFQALKNDYETLIGSGSTKISENILKQLDPVLAELRAQLQEAWTTCEEGFGENPDEDGPQKMDEAREEKGDTNSDDEESEDESADFYASSEDEGDFLRSPVIADSQGSSEDEQ